MARENAAWIGRELAPDVTRPRHEATQAAHPAPGRRAGRGGARRARRHRRRPGRVVQPGQPARALHLLGRERREPAAAASSSMPPVAPALLLGLLRRRREPDVPGGRGARPAPDRVAHARATTSTWPTSACSRATRPFGHAWSFVHQRLMGDAWCPIVPVLLNTYYPPNQPTPKRCYQLGRAIRQAIEAWPVAQARGGPRPRAASATSSSTRSWTGTSSTSSPSEDARGARRAAARRSSNPATPRSATGSRRRARSSTCAMRLVDYVPSYRSEAGSGVGMAFAVWQ